MNEHTIISILIEGISMKLARVVIAEEKVSGSEVRGQRSRWWPPVMAERAWPTCRRCGLVCIQLRRDREAVEHSKQQAIDRRLSMLQRRRADNIDNRRHLTSLQHSQHNRGLTPPWVFSYGVVWPRETYAKYRRVWDLRGPGAWGLHQHFLEWGRLLSLHCQIKSTVCCEYYKIVRA